VVSSNNNNDDGVGGQDDDNSICLSSPNNLMDWTVWVWRVLLRVSRFEVCWLFIV